MQASSTVLCKNCHSLNTARSTRKTFFERVILLNLGLHPWRCMVCKHRFLSRNRGLRKKQVDIKHRAGQVLPGQG